MKFLIHSSRGSIELDRVQPIAKQLQHYYEAVSSLWRGFDEYKFDSILLKQTRMKLAFVITLVHCGQFGRRRRHRRDSTTNDPINRKTLCKLEDFK